MKEILKTNFSQETKEGKLLAYAMMNGADTVPMKEVTDGTQIEIDKFVIYHLTKDEVNDEGVKEEMDCTVIMDPQGVMYATRSNSVKRCIEDLLELFEGDIVGITVKKVTGKAKSGNTFVSIDPII